MRTLCSVVLCSALALTAACARLQGASRPSNQKATKDCAACTRMCEVAGESEKNPGAVDACKADCKATCQ